VSGSTHPIALTLAPTAPYDRQHELEQAAAVVAGHTMVSFTGLAANYRIAAHCELNGIDGSFVECGVWRGGSSGMMAIAHRTHARAARDFHLFDAFQDPPEPDPRIDGERAVREAREWGGAEELSGRLAPLQGLYERAGLGGPGEVAAVESLLFDSVGLRREQVHIHVGWLQDTVPVADTGPIAILRLDVDHYHATRVALEHLYDRVVPGGFVIVDDYGSYEGCRRAVDSFLAEIGAAPFMHHVDADRRYFQKA
jgi:hypothetical protein